MRERGLAGLVVFAYDRYSPAMYYVTGQRIHYGLYFRAPDGRAHLIHYPMDRDQAEASVCPHAPFEQHGMTRLMDEEVSPARIFGRMIGETCATLGINGRVALFGDLPAGFAYALIARARAVHGALEVDDAHPDILSLARMTKSDAEVEQIRGVSVDGVMQTIMERGLVEAVGRAEVVGRPPTYATTSLFLEYFGLASLEDLPAADELRRIVIEKPPAPVTADAGLATTPPEQLKEASAAPKEEVPPGAPSTGDAAPAAQ